MRHSKTLAAILTLLSIGMTAGQAYADETPDIFDIIRQSDYLKTNASEVPCDPIVDYPADRYLSLCFEMNPQTATDMEQLLEVALSTGAALGKVFGEADWAVQADDVSISNPYVAFFPNSTRDACSEELFLNLYESIIELKDVSEDETDFPVQFAPTFKFHKTIGSTCVG